MRTLKLLLLATLIITNLYAKEQLINTITNDHTPQVIELILDTDELGDINRIYVDVYNKQKKLENREDVELSPTNLDALYDGIVIFTERDIDVAVLQSNNFTCSNGGNFNLVYVKNALTGSKGSLSMELERDGDKWYLSYQGEKTNSARILVKKVFFQAVGVKKIIVNTASSK